MTPLVPQTVNWNGTPSTVLLEQYVDLKEAFNALLKALQEAQPNGRDYQTSRHAFAYDEARKAFEERWLAIRAMRDEFNAAGISVAAQHWDRESRK